MRLRRIPYQLRRNVPRQGFAGHGDSREGFRLRQGSHRSVAKAPPEPISECRVHQNQLDEISHELLPQGPAQQDVLPVPGSALQEVKAQVAHHQPIAAQRIRLRVGKRSELGLI